MATNSLSRPSPPPAPTTHRREIVAPDARAYVAIHTSFNVATSAKETAHGFVDRMTGEKRLVQAIEVPNGDGGPQIWSYRAGASLPAAGRFWPANFYVRATDLGAAAPNGDEVTRVELQFKVRTHGGAAPSLDHDEAATAAAVALGLEYIRFVPEVEGPGLAAAIRGQEGVHDQVT